MHRRCVHARSAVIVTKDRGTKLAARLRRSTCLSLSLSLSRPLSLSFSIYVYIYIHIYIYNMHIYIYIHTYIHTYIMYSALPGWGPDSDSAGRPYSASRSLWPPCGAVAGLYIVACVFVCLFVCLCACLLDSSLVG